MKSSLFLLQATVIVCLLSCCRRGETVFVEPTGWIAISPVTDSLTRAIELSFQNGTGPDSTLSLMEKSEKRRPEKDQTTKRSAASFTGKGAWKYATKTELQDTSCSTRPTPWHRGRQRNI